MSILTQLYMREISSIGLLEEPVSISFNSHIHLLPLVMRKPLHSESEMGEDIL